MTLPASAEFLVQSFNLNLRKCEMTPQEGREVAALLSDLCDHHAAYQTFIEETDATRRDAFKLAALRERIVERSAKLGIKLVI